ncbi:MAG: Nif3-like dinuclear metal center hexameric protein [Bacilli bacterium]
MSKLTVQTLMGLFEKAYPSALAEEWDRIGLQVGVRHADVTGVLTTLDVTEAVVDEAIANGCNVIVSHHPLLFKPVKSLDPSTVQGRILKKCLLYDIALFAAHTNADAAHGGVSKALADRLGLVGSKILVTTQQSSYRKVVVFVPPSHLEVVKEAMHRSGAGKQGDYSDCAFMMHGKGTFRPLDGSNPYEGQTGIVSSVEEVRLEMIYPPSIEREVIGAMLDAHPYESVAYDTFDAGNLTENFGYGALGELGHPMDLATFARFTKTTLGASGVRMIGEPTKVVRKVAIVGGSGDSFWQTAMRAGADVYVSGDISYHHALDAREAGFAIVDAGHFIESVTIDMFADVLDEACRAYGFTCPVVKSRVNVEPYQFL